jgi:hypothetical protein
MAKMLTLSLKLFLLLHATTEIVGLSFPSPPLTLSACDANRYSENCALMRSFCPFAQTGIIDFLSSL